MPPSSPSPVLRLVRSVRFSASHRNFAPELSDAENRALYGSHFTNGAGYGHNFRLDVAIESEIDPLTGMIVNLKDVDAWLKTVIAEVDHRHLNDLLPQAPTLERVLLHLVGRIEEEMKLSPEAMPKTQNEALPKTRKAARLVHARLYEGDDLWVDYEARLRPVT